MGGLTNLSPSKTQLHVIQRQIYRLHFDFDETDVLSFNSITQVHPEPTLHCNQFGRALCPRGCITIGL